MSTNAKTLIKDPAGLYDRIAEVHNLAFRLNGYRDSVAKFLRSVDLGIDRDSYVLDAGSGTGVVTMALYEAGYRPRQTVAFDLSLNSLKLAAEKAGRKRKLNRGTVSPTQGNILQLPFENETFDLILSCGVLEYVPLKAGIREIARVLKPGGKMVLFPVKPSILGSILEFLYRFKIHPIENLREISQHYFKIVGDHKFPIAEPIAWSKAILLLEKK